MKTQAASLAGMTAHQIADALARNEVSKADAIAYLEAKPKLRAPSRRLLGVLKSRTAAKNIAAKLAEDDSKRARERQEFLARVKAERKTRKSAPKAPKAEPASDELTDLRAQVAELQAAMAAFTQLVGKLAK